MSEAVVGLLLVCLGAFVIWARSGASRGYGSLYPAWMGWTPRASVLIGVAMILIGLLICVQGLF